MKKRGENEDIIVEVGTRKEGMKKIGMAEIGYVLIQLIPRKGYLLNISLCRLV